jgi:hypothetical protein
MHDEKKIIGAAIQKDDALNLTGILTKIVHGD